MAINFAWLVFIGITAFFVGGTVGYVMLGGQDLEPECPEGYYCSHNPTASPFLGWYLIIEQVL